MSNKEYIAYAKCILAGEHAVLRGCCAVVMPCKAFSICLKSEVASETLVCIDRLMGGAGEDVLKKLVMSCFQFFDVKHRAVPAVKLTLSGNFPIGKGLGFSAALCSVVARWCCDFLKVDANLFVSAAHFLEAEFHGKSSGVDIVGVNADSLVVFHNINDHKVLGGELSLRAYISLVDSSSISLSTKDCVKQVMNKLKDDSSQYQAIDQQMQLAANRAVNSLQEPVLAKAQLELKSAICLAQNCFERWGLVGEADQLVLDELYTYGAFAAKITGAGGGGCILSLWQQPPPKDLNLIAC